MPGPSIDAIKKELMAKGVPEEEAEELARLRVHHDGAGDFTSTVVMSDTQAHAAKVEPATPFSSQSPTPPSAGPPSGEPPKSGDFMPFPEMPLGKDGLPAGTMEMIADLKASMAPSPEGDRLADHGRALGKIVTTSEDALDRFVEKHGLRLGTADAARLRAAMIALAKALDGDDATKAINAFHAALCGD